MTAIDFLKNIKDTDDCIDWPFSLSRDGYGQVRYMGTIMRAHRVALMLHVGRPPNTSMFACHRPIVCHNPKCVNPKHLKWATPRENVLDMRADGTRGAKLKEDDVRFIKKAIDKTGVALAESFCVSPMTISQIRTGKRWKDIQ